MHKLKESAEEKKIKHFKAAVAKHLALQGITKESLVSAMQMSRTSFWEKMNNPDTFRVGELRQLYLLLDFDEEERHILI